MIYGDFHIHSSYSDGKHTPKEIVDKAILKGMNRIGISDHSYTAFDESYCIKKEKIEEYVGCIKALKESYSDKIKIYCGIEQDYLSEAPTDCFDYVIGSVHYLFANGEYIPIDENEETLLNATKKHFNGDIYSLIEAYYNNVSNICDKHNVDIIGHFDLITKFNEGNRLFNTEDERYQVAARSAIDRLLAYNKPFEINTGAISRGYRIQAYPDSSLIRYIVNNGGNFVLSSDAHNKENIMFDFEKYFNLYMQNVIGLNI